MAEAAAYYDTPSSLSEKTIKSPVTMPKDETNGMTSVGTADFPEMSVTEAIEVIENIKREKVQTTTALGKVMGLKSVATGRFYNKLAALTKHYGLIDRQKTTVTLTPLAKRIVYQVSDEDRNAAIAEVARRVPLFKELYQSLGPEFNELDFPTKLLELTRAEHEDITEKGSRVERYYRDAIQYLRSSVPSIGGPPQEKSQRPRFHAEGSRSDAATEDSDQQTWRPVSEPGYRTFEGDGVYLRIKTDPEALEEAIATIRGWQTRHKKRKGRGK